MRREREAGREGKERFVKAEGRRRCRRDTRMPMVCYNIKKKDEKLIHQKLGEGMRAAEQKSKKKKI